MSSAFSIATGEMSKLIALSNASEEVLKKIVDETIGDGSPKEIFPTLVDLETAYPIGAVGIYLVTENGNWYYWDEAWLSGGIYQSAGILEGSVSRSELDEDLKQKTDLIPGIFNELNVQDKRINNIVAQSGNDITEIVDARLAENGKTYDSLKERLDTQNEQINAQLADITQDFNMQLADMAINVKSFGAVGDGVADDSSAFQAVLDLAISKGSVHLYASAGIYRINERLRIHANTTIELDDHTVIKRGGDVTMFINGEFDNVNYASGYNGDGNIRVIGGTYDLNSAELPPPTPSDYSYAAFALGHAKNITFTNAKMKNGHNTHYVDLCACRDVVFQNCYFTDMKVTGSNNYEALQINPAAPGAFPSFGQDDLTSCINIVVDNCLFENVHSGVGNHFLTEKPNGERVFDTKIYITNCTFNNMTNVAIRPEGWKDFIIQSCVIDTTIVNSAILGYACMDGVVSHNIIKNSAQHGIVFNNKNNYPTERVDISHNQINDVTLRGISVSAKKSKISFNQLDVIGSDGIYLGTSQDVIVSNNTAYKVSSSEDNASDGIVVSSCVGITLSDNIIDNTGSSIKMRYGVHNPSSTGTIVLRNVIKGFSTREFNNSQTDVNHGKSVGERKLTGTLNVSSGTVTLTDDITKYRYVIVATGVATGGGMRHEWARGWIDEGFRPGSDFINVATNNGKFIASIDTPTQITIISTNDPLRNIYGIL